MESKKMNKTRFMILVFVFAGIAIAQTWVELQILTASNKAAVDYFGRSVSITDNYALAGAHLADPGGILNAGAAYIFVRSGSTWTEQAILTASNKGEYDYFGSSVSLTDNYAFVGAPDTNIGGVLEAGAAYVFVRSDTTWTEQAILTASNKAAVDYFGRSVSITDNYALAGAHLADPGGISAAGSAYIFVRSGSTWTEQAILTASSKAESDYFSDSVLLINDNTALVGATGDYYYPNRRTYTFQRSGTTWTEDSISNTCCPQATTQTENYKIQGEEKANVDGIIYAGQVRIFFNSDPTPSSSFSQSISPEPIEADIITYQSTRSGNFGNAVAFMNNTLIASSPTCIDQSNCDGGRTAVIKKDINGDYVVAQILQGRHRNIDAMFGYSLATSNYWLAITSKGTSYHSAQTALVSIFGKNPDTDTIERVAGLRPKSNNQPNMDFGHSIAVGRFDIIVGVPGYDLEITIDIGAIMSFRFRISLSVWGRNPVVTKAFDATAGDRFGHSVAFDEAFLAVGNNPSDNTRHAVYILTKSGFEFAHFYKISSNGKRGFGWSVLLSEDELIVGSPQDDNNGASTNGGSVSVFAKNSTNHFVEYDTIRHTPIVAERRFGFAVARKGDRMAIGTNTCPNGAPCALQGKAYLYTKSGQQWVPRRSFSSGHVDGSDSFGTRVTIDEEDVVVGAPYSNNGSGRVYAYYVPEISG